MTDSRCHDRNNVTIDAIDAIERALDWCGLSVVGAFHTNSEDGLPGGIETVCLIGANREQMWKEFSASLESNDGHADPLDRWSRRFIEKVAAEFGAVAIFPFGEPPYQPFQQWAIRGENAETSPVSMQVTPGRGLWASYRGALGFSEVFDIEQSVAVKPCASCPAPCLTACPVGAFAGGTYDVPRCVAHITSAAGRTCREGGCLVRHVCPPGRAATPPASQRRFHMEAFIRSMSADGG